MSSKKERSLAGILESLFARLLLPFFGKRKAEYREFPIRTQPRHFHKKFSQKFASNYISSTRYNVLTFLPKFLFSEFRKTSNLAFLAISIMQQFPAVSPTGRFTTIVPLIVILCYVGVTRIVEDMKRYFADRLINRAEYERFVGGDFGWQPVLCQAIRVGDVLRLHRDKALPADCVLLASSEPSGVAYIETASLDGETNLKLRQAVAGNVYCNELGLSQLDALVRCDQPNDRLYEFSGKLLLDADQQQTTRDYTLSPAQLLPRCAHLRNTSWVLAVVVYTGRHTKIMMNNSVVRIKRAVTDSLTSYVIVFLIGVNIVLTATFSLLAHEFDYKRKFGPLSYVYGAKRAEDLVGVFMQNYGSGIVMNTQLIPISLQVTIEMARLLTASLFINGDDAMTHVPDEPGAQPIRTTARNVALNEELGQVKYVLTDKTGTLTRNVMVLKHLLCGHRVYGDARAQHHFTDKRIKSGKPLNTGLTELLQALALCHTVVAENDQQDENKVLNYRASSPDEQGLVQAAARCAFEFCGRTAGTIRFRNRGSVHEWQLVHVIEFDSYRKRMSVLLKQPDTDDYILYVKGADTTILPLLSASERDKKAALTNGLNKFAREGLRTLVFASRRVSAAVYNTWSSQMDEARRLAGSLGRAEQEAMLDSCNAVLETELKIVGASAIEDKLQEGVPDAIERLLRANVRIWMLTGDKQDTAINIARSCRLIEPFMEMVVVNETTSSELQARLQRVCHECSIREHGNSDNIGNLALVIDGNALHTALQGDLRKVFSRLALHCAVVVCCRVTPMQKAELVALVKDSGEITLSIGDGGNDVPMIQAADIGVGIVGREGMQAAAASDYSTPQFRFLVRLLFVHGHWSFFRLTKIVYYFVYKNSAVNSLQTLLPRWLLATFNLFHTSLLPLVIGIFDRPAPADMMIDHCSLYTLSQKRVAFSVKAFGEWMFLGTTHALLLLGLLHGMFSQEPWFAHGRTADVHLFGTVADMYLVVVINLKAVLETDSIGWGMLGGLALTAGGCSVFLYLYSLSFELGLPCCGDVAGIANQLFECRRAFVALPLVVVCCLLPDLLIKCWRRQFGRSIVDRVRLQCNRERGLNWWLRVKHVLLPDTVKTTADSGSPASGFAFSQDETGGVKQSALLLRSAASSNARRRQHTHTPNTDSKNNHT